MKSTLIRLDLMANAKDSLRNAVEAIAWNENGGATATQLKHAIVYSAHAVELLLKERLRRENQALIWENVDKYPSLDARTVSVATAVSRLRSIAGIPFSEADQRHIESLRKTRNAIEHFEWNTTVREARVIVGNALSVAFSFADEHLGEDLSAMFKTDDTWRSLIDGLRTFADAHGQRLAEKLKADGTLITFCDTCETPTVPLLGGSCELCGHWQISDDS